MSEKQNPREPHYGEMSYAERRAAREAAARRASEAERAQARTAPRHTPDDAPRYAGTDRPRANPAPRPKTTAPKMEDISSGSAPRRIPDDAPRYAGTDRPRVNPAPRPKTAAPKTEDISSGSAPRRERPAGTAPRRTPDDAPRYAAADRPRRPATEGQRPRNGGTAAGHGGTPPRPPRSGSGAPAGRGPQGRKTKKKSSPVLIVLTVFFAAVFLVSGSVLLWETVISPRMNDNTLDAVQTAFEDAGGIIEIPVTETEAEEPTEEDINRRAEEYAQRVLAIKEMQQTVNKDISGWVRISGTNINFPVLRSSTDDDEYYLYRNYKGESSNYGSIFISGSTPVDGDNQLLHGHSMMDGRMFWSLIDFGEAETVRNSPMIQYDTELEAGDWKIVSVFKTNTYPSQGTIFYYNEGSFSSPEEKMQFYYDVMKRSMVDTGVDLNENDKTVMLSTCSYEFDGFRTVVFARKVRDGEARSVDTKQIQAAENPLMPAVWYGGSVPTYWPDSFEDAVRSGMTDWYTGSLYDNPNAQNASPEEDASDPLDVNSNEG